MRAAVTEAAAHAAEALQQTLQQGQLQGQPARLTGSLLIARLLSFYFPSEPAQVSTLASSLGPTCTLREAAIASRVHGLSACYLRLTASLLCCTRSLAGWLCWTLIRGLLMQAGAVRPVQAHVWRGLRAAVAMAALEPRCIVLSEIAARQLMDQVLDALSAAHQQALVPILCCLGYGLALHTSGCA